MRFTSAITAIVEGFLDQYIRVDQQLLVALSGGLDSTVLLELLVRNRSRIGYRLRAVHFHHGLSSNADTWAAHCSRLCGRLQVPCDVRRLAVSLNSNQGVECFARHARYSALESMEADWILLGHHANDQAETVLLNLMRGSGVLGLAGMEPVLGRYLRPLLSLRRIELEAYAREHELQWCEDESNLDRNYTRNFVRHDVLKVLRVRFPAIDLSVSRTATHAATANKLLTDLAFIDAGTASLGFPFAIGAFKHLGTDRATNLFRVLLSSTGRQCPPTDRVHEFIRQLHQAGPDKHPEIRIGTERVFVRQKQLQIETLTFG